MSELDLLKSNVNQLSAHCHNMIQSGRIGRNVSDTVDRLVKSSLDIIAGLEKAKATPPPPPKVEPEVEPPPPKVELEPSVASPKKRKKVRKYA